MDFGLARLYDSKTATIFSGLIAGTPGYIVPELLRGDAPSHATDIFALGVLFQQVLLGDVQDAGTHSLSVKPSPALGSADAPAVFIHSVKEFLSDDPTRRCLAFQQLQSLFDAGSSANAWTLTKSPDAPPHRILTRRNFVVGSALTACAAAGGGIWQRNSINDRLNDFLHPLPQKRFVALLNWPPSSDAHIKPMVAGVIEAIGNELARAEVFDRDLFIIPQNISADTKTAAELNKIRDQLGANLVLAASGISRSNRFHLSLRVLNPASTQAIREKKLSLPLDERLSFPSKAVRAAAELLNVNRFEHNDLRTTPDTTTPEAFAAFQEAETLMKQDNDKGLEAAVDKYKQAVELDPRYATAYAKLAWAYLRFYGLRSASFDQPVWSRLRMRCLSITLAQCISSKAGCPKRKPFSNGALILVSTNGRRKAWRQHFAAKVSPLKRSRSA
jgi:eukaryotic-like serine/threonine-protein kinase